jgi:hypothetical protein
LSSERNLLLSRLRAILAILIAVSLTLTPVASAWAAGQMPGRTATSAHADMAAAEMSDCHKAAKPAVPKNCPCCDAPSKSPCPDAGMCLVKCGMHVLAVLAPSSEGQVIVVRHNLPADPEKPPDWWLSPPAPPPRA